MLGSTVTSVRNWGFDVVGKFQYGWQQLGRLARSNQWQLMILGTIASLAGLFAGFGGDSAEVDRSMAEATSIETAPATLQKTLADGKEIELHLNLNDDGGKANIDEIDFLRENAGREIKMRISLYHRGNWASDAGFQKACQTRHKGVKLYTIFDDDFIGHPIAVNQGEFVKDGVNVPNPEDCGTLLVINSRKNSHSSTHDTVADQNIVLAGLFRIRVEGAAWGKETFYLDQIDLTHIKVH